MNDTEKRLEEIKARAEAATHGPWKIAIGIGEIDAGYDITSKAGRIALEVSDSNSEFIAHAREDVPDLIAEMERLRAALAIMANKNNYTFADFVDRGQTNVWLFTRGKNWDTWDFAADVLLPTEGPKS